MVDYKYENATYAINSYVWKLIEANLGWVKTDYQGATPIIPAQQQPELLNLGKPFLVYGSADHPPGNLYALRKISISYSIYGTSSTETNKVVELLADVFKRQDDAAADVNIWMETEADGAGKGRNLGFSSIKATLTEHAVPADQEGGFVAGLVILEVVFAHFDHDADGTYTGPVTSGFTYTA